MRHIYKVGLMLLPLMMLALAGCSSSSSGGAADPFATTSGGTDPGTRAGTTVYSNFSTAAGRSGITLTSDRASVDTNNGQVVVTAKIVSFGVAISGVPVTFSIVAPLNGPATVDPGLTTVTTDSNGTAITRIAIGSSSSTTNVIVAATATVGSYRVTANTTFQITRGTGVIDFGATTAQSAHINANLEASHVFQQQIPLRLTDSNGNPRVGAAVTLSVYTSSGTSSAVITQPTISTDSSGVAIFNATVTKPAPTPGLTSMDSVIYKATTSDANPVVGYVAEYYSLTSIAPDATIPTITLSTDRSIYDANSGIVTATAKIFLDGVAVSDKEVTFTKLSGPVSLGYATPRTDKNGISIATFTVDDSKALANTIIQASVTLQGATYVAYAQFQVNGSDPTATPIPTVIMTLTSDRSQVDVNNGTVMLNANLIYGADYLISNDFITHGTPLEDRTVSFAVIAGPATITGSTLQTDKNGNAKAVLTTGNAAITTNIIVEASAVFDDGKTYRAFTTIQVVRGTGVIKFVTTSDQTDPNGTLTVLSNTEKYNSQVQSVTFRQLIPFKLTDSNGNPRVGVPVTLDIYSQSGSAGVIINFLKNGVTEPTARTVTTDSAGAGIFNVTVTLPVPSLPGANINDGIVYRAITNDAIPLIAYGGFVVNSNRGTAPETSTISIMISPDLAYFAATDTAGTIMQFSISGGKAPYTVTASNPTRVSVALQPDGVTATATLVDASQWTGLVSFSVLDSQGNAALVTPNIYRK